MLNWLRQVITKILHWFSGAKQSEQAKTPIPPIPPIQSEQSKTQNTSPVGQAELNLASTQQPEYRSHNSIFTFRERIFYNALARDVGNQYHIFPKVRMGDIFWLANEPQDRKFHNNQIQCKHFDFVLCNRVSYSPVMVIELDDSSHHKADHQARDEFKDNLCKQAGLPIWRVNIQREYPAGYIVAQIRERLENNLKSDLV